MAFLWFIKLKVAHGVIDSYWVERQYCSVSGSSYFVRPELGGKGGLTGVGFLHFPEGRQGRGGRLVDKEDCFPKK